MYLPSPHSIHLPSVSHRLLVNIFLVWKFTTGFLTAPSRPLTFLTVQQLLSLDPGAKPCLLDPVIFSAAARRVALRLSPQEDGSSVFQKCLETFSSAPAIDGTSSHRTSGRGTRQCSSKTGTRSSNSNLILIDTSPRDDVGSNFSVLHSTGGILYCPVFTGGIPYCPVLSKQRFGVK